MSRSTFDRWLLAAAGLIVLLAAAVVLTVQNTRRLNEDAGWVSHTHEVMDAVEDCRSQLREAEAVQRTYLITGGDAVPPAVAESVDAAKHQVMRAHDLAADNPDQQARVPEILTGIDASRGSTPPAKPSKRAAAAT
jgi:methyl-accepting chemotaxis protein